MNQWLVLLGGAGIGYAIVVNNRKMVAMFGQSAWAERKFGPGGSFTMWKIGGMIVAFLSLLYFTGDLSCVRKGFESFFSGLRS